MFYLIISFLSCLLGLFAGFVVGRLSQTKIYNDSFYDFGFVSGYEVGRSNFYGGKAKNEVPDSCTMDSTCP